MSTDDTRAMFEDLVAAKPVCTLITVDTMGRAVPRPMGVAAVEEGPTVWFITFVGSRKVAHIAAEPRVTVYWEHSAPGGDDWTYGQLYGVAEVTTDRATRDRLWKDEWTRYFPGGSADPSMALIKVTSTRLELRASGEPEMRVVDL